MTELGGGELALGGQILRQGIEIDLGLRLERGKRDHIRVGRQRFQRGRGVRAKLR